MTDRSDRWGNFILPMFAVVIGIAGNVIWFSNQYGGQQARIEGLEHRIGVIETTGSPALQRWLTQVEVDTRAIDEFRKIPDQIGDLRASDGRIDERLKELERMFAIAETWRIQHIHEDGEAYGKLGEFSDRLNRVGERVDKAMK